jgi:hypothetical protein
MMPVCCSRAEAEPPSMNIIAARIAPAGRQPRLRKSRRMPIAPGRKWAKTTASKSFIDGEGTTHANSSMVGVKSRDCGSATEGWPPKW